MALNFKQGNNGLQVIKHHNLSGKIYGHQPSKHIGVQLISPEANELKVPVFKQVPRLMQQHYNIMMHSHLPNTFE